MKLKALHFAFAPFLILASACSSGSTPSPPTVVDAIAQQAAAASSKTVLTTSGDRRNRGRIVEFPIPIASSSPARIVFAPDGNMWFNENIGYIAYITPTGSITSLAVNDPVNPIVEVLRPGIGPNGEVWFANDGANSGFLGRVDRSHAITYYETPDTGFPQGPIAGPDDKVWFSELDTNHVASITANGAITEYLVPTPNALPYSLTLGPDHAVWFTEANAGKIGRITSDGSITERALPNPNSDPDLITVGPDGNFWFVENTVDGSIDRMTLAGDLKRFPLPPNCQSINAEFGFAWTPKRKLYFTCPGTDEIGLMRDDGSTRLFQVPTPNAVPLGIASDNDGNIWFTENAGNKIGVLYADEDSRQ